MAPSPVRIGALASGNGSNLQAIVDQCDSGAIPGKVVLVLSDKRNAGALRRAADHGIPHRFIDPGLFSDRGMYDTNLVEELLKAKVDLVVLAGYMRLVSDQFVDTFPNRIMNIHPSLLPAFPGLHVQRQALEHGARFSGCTVHFVDKGLDTGPIIQQAVVPILPDDTVETLSKRILKEEHRIYPRAVQLFAQGRLHVEGRRVIFQAGPAVSEWAQYSPPLSE